VGTKKDEDLVHLLDSRNLNLVRPVDYWSRTSWMIPKLSLHHSKRFIDSFPKDSFLMLIKLYRPCERISEILLSRYLVTFSNVKEAFNKTRRILNITVSSSKTYEMPCLLNYLTAPNVVRFSWLITLVDLVCSVSICWVAK
jgi:hypothetical protein